MYLNVHSQYSLRYGTMSIESLITHAKTNGITQMVLTDINNSTGIMEFMRDCKKNHIKPIGGIEFRRDNKLLYIGIAKNREGMKELNDFLTLHNMQKKELPDLPPVFNHVSVVYPFHFDIKLRENEFAGIRFDELHTLHGKDISALKNRLVALQPVVVSGKLEFRLHEYLRAIDLNTLLSKVNDDDKCRQTDQFLPAGVLEANFSKFAFILDNTRELMSGCELDYLMEDKLKLNRKSFTGSQKGDKELLELLAMNGMITRYGKHNEEALKRVHKELKVIDEQNFCSYFLITWDILRYANEQGYYHVGRGSGANSVVAYCLRITDVDPIELDLYFERFLNAERTSPPDFDLDFSWDEREDVQEYIFKRYGRDYTALLGTMTTFKDKSVIREIGKVMGLPKDEIDGFTDPSRSVENRNNTTFKKISAIFELMGSMPNQRSIHAGGVLISEEPITYYTALDLPPKGMATVQWDMYEAEKIGYDKYDILSQRGIGHIKEAVKLIGMNKKEKVDIHDVKAFMKDPNLNVRLKIGNTIGCFYIESPAMRQLLYKLKCDNYLVLVAASSIIRPGVASSGMMSAYIRNHHDPSKVVYLHPVMKELLEETYGIMVYQEDVIKICVHFAGMSGTDADILRRGMSGKYRSKAEFDKLVMRFTEGAKQLGRPEETITEVWRQVSSFAGYSFSKAHSASFAVESYQSLFLKTYYPQEFMVAVLNNYGGFYSRWLYVYELKNSGATVHLPCVNHSDIVVNIKGSDAYLGFIGILGLETTYAELIPLERKRNGLFTSLENFLKRTGIGLEQAVILIRLGALRFTGKSKKAMLWDVYLLFGNKLKPFNHAELFEVEQKNHAMPELINSKLEDAYHEMELLGFPLTLSMFDLLKTSYRGDVQTKDLPQYIGQTAKMVGWYVCEKRVNTKNNKKMWFGTFLDAQGNFFDTTHFPNNTPAYPFRGAGCYLIYGKIVEDFGSPSVEVLKFAKLPLMENPVFV